MKNYNFIPHAANTRSRSQVINLIEAEGAAGYGFYWALLEYLRAQKHYIGDIRSIKNIARQMKVRIDKALRILNNYGLFIVEEVDFHSPFLDEKMSLMKRKYDKPCRKNVESVSENVETLPEAPCNPLEINVASFKEEKRKEKKKQRLRRLKKTPPPLSCPGKDIQTACATKSNGRKSWPYEVDLPEFYLPVQRGAATL
jgi:hypothetical protein